MKDDNAEIKQYESNYRNLMQEVCGTGFKKSELTVVAKELRQDMKRFLLDENEGTVSQLKNQMTLLRKQSESLKQEIAQLKQEASEANARKAMEQVKNYINEKAISLRQEAGKVMNELQKECLSEYEETILARAKEKTAFLTEINAYLKLMKEHGIEKEDIKAAFPVLTQTFIESLSYVYWAASKNAKQGRDDKPEKGKKSWGHNTDDDFLF